MRRIATSIIGVALVAFYLACSADSPAPTQNGGGGSHPTPTSTALQVRLFTSNANPLAGSCTLIQAIVSLNGANVPDGTGVVFSTDNGFFEQNSGVFVSITTQGGAAVTAVCSSNPGLSNVRATATVAGQTGAGSIAISFQPTFQAGPFFTSCSPSFAANTGGTNLVLNGGRFFGTTATTRVTFTAAGITREALVTGVTASSVTVVTPAFPEALAPSVPVTITLILGTNSSSPTILTIPNCFAFGTVGSTTPSITAVLPATGTNEGNTRVSIVGSGFAAPLQVFFGLAEAQVISISYNQIVALTPPASGAGQGNLNQQVDVRVIETTSGVTGLLSGGFRYVTKMLITSISNNNQRVDEPFTQVTINGQGFDAPVAVSLAGIAAQVISVSATQLIVVPGAPQVAGCADLSGTVHIVSINTGDSADGASFTYLVAQTKPIVSSVSPSSAPGGTQLTIRGENFSGITSVTIGGRAVPFSVNAAGTIFATAPDFSNGTQPACPVGTGSGSQVPVGAAEDVVVTSITGCAGTASGAFQGTAACGP